jgi:putative phosphonate metabolism protein
MTDTALDGYARYAVYFAPPEGDALSETGAAWLGWDAAAGEERAAPVGVSEALRAARPELTRRARRYGFHATLKAPFRLAGGVDGAALDAALRDFAAATPPAEGPGLAVRHGDGMGFVALRPSAPAPEIDALAGRCVTGLDGMRAALTDDELAEKRRGGLDPVAEANLRDWGYPYVLERFRFHMTLTGPVSDEAAARIVPELEALFAPALTRALRIGEIALFGDPGAGAPFRLLRRYALTG